MCERFIKFIPSEEAMWLLKNRGHAFRLLTIIAESTCRYEGHMDTLHVGESFIGGFENYDMTEQNYRTAKKILVERGHIEIIETNRKFQEKKGGVTTSKRKPNGSLTTSLTTSGTKVRLLNSMVWDLNLKGGNDLPNGDLTTSDDKPNDPLYIILNKEVIIRNNNNNNKNPIVVFSSLQNFNDSSITQSHKEEFVKKYSQETIEDAISVISEPGFIFSGTKLKALRAACKGVWKPNNGGKNDVKKNKILAQKIPETLNHCKYIVCNAYLEIVRGVLSHIIKFEMPHEKFCDEIERLGKIKIENSLKML